MKVNSLTKPLTARQLFGIKRENLEKKVLAYYETTHDAASVVEYAVAILVRHALVVSDFTGLFQELIREIYLTVEPDETLKKHCMYFKNYFKSGEWDQVISRLFGNKKNYQHFSKKTFVYDQRLKAGGSGECKNPDLQMRIVSIFEDANGKKHTLTIGVADERNSKPEVEGILQILTTLSIFETNGVRRFASFVKSTRPGIKETFIDEERQQEEPMPEMKKAAGSESREVREIRIVVPDEVDPSKLSEEEVLMLVQGGHPEITDLADVQVIFLKDREDSQAIMRSESSEAQSDSLEPEPPEKEKSKKRVPIIFKQAYVQELIKNFGKRKARSGK